MGIKIGSTNVVPAGINKAYLGTDLVFQKDVPNYAPASTTCLMHLNGNLKNEVDGLTMSGSYKSTIGKFDEGSQTYSGYAFDTNNSYGYTYTQLNTGNCELTIEYWGRDVNPNSRTYSNTFNLEQFK